MIGVAVGTGVGGAVIRIIVGSPADSSAVSACWLSIELMKNNPIPIAAIVNKMPASSHRRGDDPELLLSGFSSASNSEISFCARPIVIG